METGCHGNQGLRLIDYSKGRERGGGGGVYGGGGGGGGGKTCDNLSGKLKRTL